MGGFTLYETLRILVPGVMTTLVLDFGLRAGFGPGAFAADGGVAGFVGFLESTAGFTAFSLAVGLLLYMIDIAVKLRIFRGDPGRDRPLPSQTLEVMLAGSPRQEDAFSVYFALTDRYLPEEMRKRVYLNGSLFRIYVDLRIVAALVFVGVAAAARLAVAEGGDVRDATPSVAESLVAVALIGVIIIVGVYGIRQHAVNYRRKHADHPVPNFGQQLVSDLLGGLLPALLVGALGTAGARWVVSERDAVRIAGVVVAGLQAFLWLGLEVGPPDPAPPTTVRDWIIGKIGGRRHDVQYAPVQRLVYDLALFAPWVVAIASVNAALGREPGEVAAWAALVLPPVVVMSFRKHEERLLQTYHEQSVWLEMHNKDVDEIKKTGLLPDRWE